MYLCGRMRAFAGLSFLDSEVGAFVIRLLSKYFISIYELQPLQLLLVFSERII